MENNSVYKCLTKLTPIFNEVRIGKIKCIVSLTN